MTSTDSRATDYVGRFAPSPTGPLHAGSLVAALASYLDARAHRGKWLLRIEDIDPPREEPGATGAIIAALTAHGMVADGPVSWQSHHDQRYESALTALSQRRLAYRCRCSRSQIIAARRALGLADAPPGHHTPYPGTCRDAEVPASEPHSWRFNCDGPPIRWLERRDGHTVTESVSDRVGDFVLRRRDRLWSYQLAVVVDDAAAGVTDVVRGDDLADNTARQCSLQSALGYQRPRYLHIPVLRDAQGNKLSKQTLAPALPMPGNEREAIGQLNRALTHLQLNPVAVDTLARFWPDAIRQWAVRYAD